MRGCEAHSGLRDSTGSKPTDRVCVCVISHPVTVELLTLMRMCVFTIAIEAL